MRYKNILASLLSPEAATISRGEAKEKQLLWKATKHLLSSK